MVKRLLGLILLMIGVAGFSPLYQQPSSTITMSVNAGFDGSFRDDQWIPVYIRVGNDGDDVEGRLVVRPETSNAVDSSYSLPISLPTGARKAVFLYITAQSFATQIRVELIDNNGVVVDAEPATLRSLQPRDQLQVVISQSPTGVVDLTGIHENGFNGFQANWQIENIPDRAVALNAVNMMMFSDVDTTTLSTAQKTAINDWVAQGGHLLVTGGTNWQTTAAGLSDLLPLLPKDSTSLDSLTPISDWTHFNSGDLKQQTVIATGILQPDAKVLVKTAGNQPLVARRILGSGIVDYLVADPNEAPLRGWGGLSDFWLNLASIGNPQPSWAFGVSDWNSANSAINVLPGVDLLPDILPLCGFLALYIALIGPLNYLVLNRINRRELAWVTIPLFIIIFSALAWVVGFNLRGNEVTLTRMSVVQSWPNAPDAEVQQLIGLLSPRRAQYSLDMTDASFLRPIPVVNTASSSLLSGNVQISTDIQQADTFRAANFPVDASFIAPFQAASTIAKPDISGTGTLSYDTANNVETIRGSVTNNTGFPLTDPVILVRGQALRLKTPLDAGAVIPFEVTLPGGAVPSPAPLAYEAGSFASLSFRSYTYQNDFPQTVKDILGDQLPNRNYYLFQGTGNTPEQQEYYRRSLFLSSFVNDPYDVLTGRGDQAYLAAWSDQPPLGINLEGGTCKSIDTTLYLAQLDIQPTTPAGEVVIASDQFTWTVQDQTTVTDAAPIGMTFQPGDQVVFRFTPLPDAVLSKVDDLTIYVDRGDTINHELPFYLWNWDKSDWESFQIETGNTIAISDPQRFLGPDNAIQIRIVADEIGSYPRFDNLSVEQSGQF